MATLNQIVENIAASIDKPFDDYLKERLKFTVKYWRAELIRQDVERNVLDNSIIQSFITRLVSVDSADSCVVTTGCKVLRTEKPIPRNVSLKMNGTYLYVGPVKFMSPNAFPYKEATTDEIMFLEYEPLTKDIPRVRNVNGYLYVYGNCLQKYIQIDGIAEDPAKFHEACVDSVNCFDDDVDTFPISAHMLTRIYNGIRSGELTIMTNDQEVNVNN